MNLIDLTPGRDARKYLEVLFAELSVPSVTHLELKGWVVTASVVGTGITSAFPAMVRLRMEGIVMTGKHEELWITALTSLLTDRAVEFELEGLRYGGASGKKLRVKDLSLETQGALRRLVRR